MGRDDDGRDVASGDQGVYLFGFHTTPLTLILDSRCISEMVRFAGIGSHGESPNLLSGVCTDTWMQGYNLAHQTDLTIFEEIAKHPRRAQRYAEAMSWFNTGPGLEPTHILESYPWESLGTGIVVDVGGGYGSVSIALAQRFPLVRCIVQDRPEVVKDARARLPLGLADRVSFVEHDFFTKQPAKNVDVFFLRWILHDWPDMHAIRILQSLIPALKSGVRLLVNEYILPEPGAVSSYQEKMFR